MPLGSVQKMGKPAIRLQPCDFSIPSEFSGTRAQRFDVDEPGRCGPPAPAPDRNRRRSNRNHPEERSQSKVRNADFEGIRFLMRKGEYHKVVGGNFGAYWNGRKWERFDCDGCMVAAGLVHPGDRRQGPPTPKAVEALRFGKVVHRHNRELHSQWLKDGKPIRARRVTE